MATIGNDVLPGPVTEVTSASFIGVFPSTPRDSVIMGPADLGTEAGQGNADETTLYNVVSFGQAEDLFGQVSPLTRGCKLALGNGCKPVYAISPKAQTAQDEDISGSATGTLKNHPCSEDPSDYTITIDSTDQTVELYTTGLPEDSPQDGTVYIVPQTGKYDLGTAPSTSATAAYDYYNYDEALQEMQEKVASLVDFIAPLQEGEDIASNVQLMTGSLEQHENFSIGLISAGVDIDTSTFTQSFDDSRMQMYYPTRDADGKNIMGAVAGKRANLSLSATAIMKSLAGITNMAHRLSLSEKQNLIKERVNPIGSKSSGAVIIDDLTTVSDTNSDERNIDTGFARMVMDAVITLVIENEEPFIGEFNVDSTRNALRGVLITQLENLVRSDDITDYTVEVTERTARSADVRVAVETVRGLRNIYNTISAGIRRDLSDEEL
jgi:hypothetical protein